MAFIRKPIPAEEGGGESWVLFNDEKVVKAQGDVDEMKKFAYVYFFERIKKLDSTKSITGKLHASHGVMVA